MIPRAKYCGEEFFTKYLFLYIIPALLEGWPSGLWQWIANPRASKKRRTGSNDTNGNLYS